jgi:Recombinase zinc beta ribbon domain
VRASDGRYANQTAHGLKPKEEWIAVPVPDAGIPREVAERARRILEYSLRRANVSKERRVWELTGGLLHCGECGRRMVTHSVTPSGRKPCYYYVCPRKVEGSSQACTNKYHRAEALEKRAREAVAALLTDPERLERQIEERIERERETVRDPEAEAAVWVKKLEGVAKKRARFQDQQAAELLTLSELGEMLHYLGEEREAAQRELEVARDRQARVEELERDRTIVLALYAGFASASADLTVFPPEERRRIHASLGLKATVYKDGRVEITGTFGDDFFAAQAETHELLEHVVYDPEQIRAREELRAWIAEKKYTGGVMSCGGSR